MKNIIKIGLAGLGVSMILTGCNVSNASNINISKYNNTDKNLEENKLLRDNYIDSFKVRYVTYKSNYDYETTINNIKEDTKKYKWKVLKEIDYKKKLDKMTKSDKHYKTTVLELCQGKQASKLISNNKTLNNSILLPCKIAIHENIDKSVSITIMDLNFSSQKIFNEVSQDQINIIKRNLKG